MKTPVNLQTDNDFFIPDLCRMSSLLFLVIMTELVALLMALVSSENELLNWYNLGTFSLFGTWTTLCITALLCSLRHWLARQTTSIAATYSFVLIMGITLLFSAAARHLINQPFSSSVQHMSDLDYYLRNALIAAIIGGITLRYFYLRNQWQKQRQAEMSARLEALQARIRPHFLFNSMNTIASLIAIDPDKAEEAVLDLSSLFRATLQTQQLLVPLRDEIALCQRYLHIESLRLGDRMTINWQLDETAANTVIPPLTLQPLVENAIYHGIQPRKTGGEIRIETRYEKDHVYILVSNPFNQNDPGTHQAQGNRIALTNIRHRLESLFHEKAAFKASQHNGIYTATIRLPYRTIEQNGH